MIEKDSAYYDKIYSERDEYKIHYRSSCYCYLWKIVIEWLSLYMKPEILEIGCGTGQFASMLYDNGYTKYTGIDFSGKAIQIAKQTTKQTFYVDDIHNIHNYVYNMIIALEVLEHIEKDIEVMNNIKDDTDIIFMVPKFDDPAHVRYFKNKDEVTERYKLQYSDVYEDSKFILCRAKK